MATGEKGHVKIKTFQGYGYVGAQDLVDRRMDRRDPIGTGKLSFGLSSRENTRRIPSGSIHEPQGRGQDGEGDNDHLEFARAKAEEEEEKEK